MAHHGANIGYHVVKHVSQGHQSEPSAPGDSYGYYTDGAYTHQVFPVYDPRRISVLAELSGHPGPDPTQPFTFADFGCGHGMTVLMLAKALPIGQYFGIDLMPDHVRVARDAARRLGLKNVTFLQAGFDQVSSADLPRLDFATAHGVLSWIAPEARRHLNAIVSDRLKPDGLFMVSYNHVAGWGDMLAARELLRDGVDAGVDDEQMRLIVARLLHAGVTKGSTRPPRLLKSLLNKDMNYVRHEFLNRHWTCFTNRQVAGEMSAHGMIPVGPWTSPMLAKPLAERSAPVEDPVFWEDAFSARQRASFRYALFAHGDGPVAPFNRPPRVSAGWVTLSPNKAAARIPGFGATSFGDGPPYPALPVADLVRSAAKLTHRVNLTSILRSTGSFLTGVDAHPVHGIERFTLTADVVEQDRAFSDLGLDIRAISVPERQALIQMPVQIRHMLRLFADQSPDAYADLLAANGMSGKSRERIPKAVAAWRRNWAPWLAGLGVI